MNPKALVWLLAVVCGGFLLFLLVRPPPALDEIQEGKKDVSDGGSEQLGAVTAGLIEPQSSEVIEILASPEIMIDAEAEAIRIADIVLPSVKKWEVENVFKLEGINEDLTPGGSTSFLMVPPLGGEVLDTIRDLSNSNEVEEQVYKFVGANPFDTRFLRFFVHHSDPQNDEAVIWNAESEDAASVDPISGNVTIKSSSGFRFSSLDDKIKERFGHLYRVEDDLSQESGEME